MEDWQKELIELSRANPAAEEARKRGYKVIVGEKIAQYKGREDAAVYAAQECEYGVCKDGFVVVEAYEDGEWMSNWVAENPNSIEKEIGLA